MKKNPIAEAIDISRVADRHQQWTFSGLITAWSGAAWTAAGTVAKVSGRCSRWARLKGSTIAGAGPTTDSTGTNAVAPLTVPGETSVR